MRNTLGKTVEREGLEVSTGIVFYFLFFIFGKPEKGAVNGRRDKLGGSESWEGKAQGGDGRPAQGGGGERSRGTKTR